MGILPDFSQGLDGLLRYLPDLFSSQSEAQPAGQPAPARPMIPPPSLGPLPWGERPMEALGGLVNGAGLWNAGETLFAGRRSDPQTISDNNMRLVYHNLVKAGLSQDQALAAVMNPKVMEAAIPNIIPKYEYKESGQQYGRFNPASGQFDIQGASPKFEQVTPGNTAGYATPPTPVSPMTPRSPTGQPAPASGGFQPVIQGGVKMDDVSGMRKEVTGLPEVKRYSEALPVFRSMTESHGTNTSAADLDFVYGVAKIFDPDSVVREGEMKLIGKAQSLPEDVKGFIQSVSMGGARLSPEARARILEVARIRMNELKGSLDQRLKPYEGIADRNKINRADIMPQFQEFPGTPAPPIAKPGDAGMTPVIDTKKLTPTQRQLMDTAPENSIVRIDGQRVMKKNGEWVPVK